MAVVVGRVVDRLDVASSDDGDVAQRDGGPGAGNRDKDRFDFLHGLEPALGFEDDVHIVEVLQGLGTNYCTANANSTGNPAVISATGSAAAADNLLTLLVEDMPNGQFAYFVCGPLSYT